MTRRRSGRVVDRKYRNGHVSYRDPYKYSDRYTRSRRSYARDNYEQEDDYDDFSDTMTGRLVGKMSNTYNKSKQTTADNKAAKKAVTCNKCEYDSCEKVGRYYDIKSGKEAMF